MGNLSSSILSSEMIWENRWAEQSNLIVSNPIYSLVDIYGGGRLIDCYETEGAAAVRRIIKDEVTPYLYKGGDGIEISGADLIRKPVTKYEVPDEDPLKTRSTMVSTMAMQDLDKSMAAQLNREQPRKNVPMRLFNSAAPVYDNSVQHLVCWDITKRGIYGETLLHLCLLHKTPAHRQLAIILISLFPNLVKDFFIGWEYFGQSALHMAILNNDFELVKLIVQAGPDIHQRAVGDFFQPDDQRSVRKAKVTDYKGHTYYGEYPLSFACCIGSPEIYDYLIVNGADPSNKDQLGNSVLHMLVIHNQTEVYRLALRHYKRPADPNAVNLAGLNPISLAAKLGRRRVFNEIVGLSASEMWRYGDIACKLYPLTGVDTIGPGGQTDWDSAFMHIINGQTGEHLDMLDEGVIRQLLYEKWNKYVRKRFLQRLALTIAYLLIMTLAVYLRPYENWTVSGNSTIIVRQSIKVNGQNVVRYVCEIVTVINSKLTLYFMIKEIREQGFRAFTRTLTHAPPRAAYIVACILIALALPARIGVLLWTDQWQTMTLIEESLLILAIPCVWTYLLFFASGTNLYGTFVTLIYKMLSGDVLRFGIIYSILSTCFGQAFFFLFRDIEQITIGSFQDVLTTVMTVFQMTHGEFKMSKGEFLIKYAEFNYTKYPFMSKIVFVSFMISMPIMLLNMIIANMDHTYSTVNSRSQKESIAMWARIVVIVERSFNSQQLLAYRNGYTIPVPGKDGEFGLMTIYRTKKTLAKQRVTAQCNWKRSYRKVLQLIRDHRQLGNSKPFTFDGTDVSLTTVRQQKTRLLNLQKQAARINRHGVRPSDDKKSTADLSESIQEIMRSVPLESATSAPANSSAAKQRRPLVKQVASIDEQSTSLSRPDTSSKKSTVERSRASAATSSSSGQRKSLPNSSAGTSKTR